MNAYTSQTEISQYDTLRRGPSAYQGRGQYYEVLNYFFSSGKRVRRCEHFKRIGDKQGWGQREWIEGLELDRKFFFDLNPALTQAGARLAELVADGCQVVSYKKKDAPGGMVTYVLVSWPTNRELEHNRVTRVLRKQAKQASLPRSATPFQHPQFRIEAGSEREPRRESRHDVAQRFEQEYKPKQLTQSTADDCPLFAGVRP